MSSPVLKPFFRFYGSKWRIARFYPPPAFGTIVEPFAGSAGYSLHHAGKQVILSDIDPIIAGLWNYLIHVKPREILSLPDKVTDVAVLRLPEAQHLIGFWLNSGSATPKKTATTWSYRSDKGQLHWGPAVKQRIADQLQYIRHWTIECIDYRQQFGCHQATWFIDPPYLTRGRHYRFHQISYTELAEWAQDRRGQVMVCEQSDADWLPFQPFRKTHALEGKTGHTFSEEVIWQNGLI